MPDWCVLSLSRAGRDRTHHDLAGVYADAPFDRQIPGFAQSRRIAFQFFLDAQRRIERPLRMVLVRDRRAEQRENPIAGLLHDVTIVPLDRLDH
jgi:hypothetical protein